jgi:hypothetical protein
MRLSGTSLLFALALLGLDAASASVQAQVLYAQAPPAVYPGVSYYYAPGYTSVYSNYYPRNALYFPPSAMPTWFYEPAYASPAYSSGASFYGPSTPRQNIVSYYGPIYGLTVPPVTTTYYYWGPPAPAIYPPYYR